MKYKNTRKTKFPERKKKKKDSQSNNKRRKIELKGKMSYTISGVIIFNLESYAQPNYRSNVRIE